MGHLLCIDNPNERLYGKEKPTCMITKKQMAALQYVIAQSPDATDFSKKTSFFLLEKSIYLTIPVCLSIIKSNEVSLGLINQFNYCNHDMRSSAKRTHLSELMMITGSDFIFSGSSGYYDNDGAWNAGKNEHSGTIWLSPMPYDPHALKILFNKKIIQAVSLKSGLYDDEE